MVSPEEHIQFLYELAMSTGTSLDLKKMLRQSVSTILRKVNCSAGSVHLIRQEGENTYFFERVYSIPRNPERITKYQVALASIPERMTSIELAEAREELPIHGQIGYGRFYHIAELPGIGAPILLKNGKDIAPAVLKSLAPMFARLADAIIACLQNEELQRHRVNLEELVAAKSQELLKKYQLLEMEIRERKRAEKDKEALIDELQEALASVKTLKGMLPICANCKNIRDDRGYWNAIEVYIGKHSDTLFSHCICPKCAEELYGNEEWFKKNPPRPNPPEDPPYREASQAPSRRQKEIR